MLCHAYAPDSSPAPELYCQYTWVKELGLCWDELGGLSREEIGLLAQMVSIAHEAEALKARVQSGGKG